MGSVAPNSSSIDEWRHHTRPHHLTRRTHTRHTRHARPHLLKPTDRRLLDSARISAARCWSATQGIRLGASYERHREFMMGVLPCSEPLSASNRVLEHLARRPEKCNQTGSRSASQSRRRRVRRRGASRGLESIPVIESRSILDTMRGAPVYSAFLKLRNDEKFRIDFQRNFKHQTLRPARAENWPHGIDVKYAEHIEGITEQCSVRLNAKSDQPKVSTAHRQGLDDFKLVLLEATLYTGRASADDLSRSNIVSLCVCSLLPLKYWPQTFISLMNRVSRFLIIKVLSLTHFDWRLKAWRSKNRKQRCTSAAIAHTHCYTHKLHVLSI